MIRSKNIGVILVIVLLGLASGIRAQQQPLYSQYMLDPFLVNPAVAGAEGVTAVNLTARQQWIGYSEAPATYALSAQTRILKTSFRNRSRLIKTRVRRRRPSGRVGLGAFVFNDNNGRIHRTGFQATYAYHIYMRDYQISFGASLTSFQFKASVTSVDGYDQTNDPLLSGKTSKFAPDANFGVLLSSQKYYVGFSATSLFQSFIQFGGTNTEVAYRLLRQYYLVGGYRYQPYRSDFAIEPSVLFTTNERFQFGADLNIKGYYKNDYWAGISIRSTGAVVTMIGIKYQQFYFGYAFDYSFSDVSTFSKAGSHELMLGMKLGDTQRRYRWLNRF
ncbi:PorP/SprF family type IX secretion system membrane protein [Tenuifilum thalassicum]|uniref:Type IX secretion system membrane protein PorP/SprF n=1 Tax=Tenuifilum thalassicum TaxID=2590900 RepID=A0A7D4BCX4_9BACT|nr:type IX secretion system membrane protein PorP/SprF [Tenuifilum thalassicum]QKG78918.1 type IX secretion system membrane protein PorP/SprF [Tenuifilum thalassicum]